MYLAFGNFNPPASTGGMTIECAQRVTLKDVRIIHARRRHNPSLRLNGRVDSVALQNVELSGDLYVQDYLATTITVDTGTDVITGATNSLQNGDLVQCFNSTPANLPAGLLFHKQYYVVNVSGLTFQLSETPGGTPVNITGAGSGTSHVYRVLKELHHRARVQRGLRDDLRHLPAGDAAGAGDRRLRVPSLKQHAPAHAGAGRAVRLPVDPQPVLQLRHEHHVPHDQLHHPLVDHGVCRQPARAALHGQPRHVVGREGTPL